MPRKVLIAVIASLTIAIILPGCVTSSEPNIKDGGLITGKPCGAPCFYEIYLGSSTFDETKTALEKYGMADTCREEKKAIDLYICGNNTLQIGFTGDSKYVNLIFFHLKPSIPIKEIITIYGEPESIMVLYGGTTPEHPRYSFHLFYPEQKMILTTSSREGDSFTIESTTLVEDVAYSLEPLITTDKKQRWVGYGTYTYIP